METESFTIVNENEHDINGQILRQKKVGKHKCIIFSNGLMDTQKTPYIKTLSKKFLDAGWVIIVYDSSNSFGESGGRAEDITISQRVSDLERVVSYAKRRSYINDKKVVVFGHCFGAMSALAMEGFQHILSGLVLISVPARIEESAVTRKSDHDMSRIRLKRYFHIHHDEIGKEVRINYSFFEDGNKQDMDRAARNLKTPTIFIHGEQDTSIPMDNAERMYARAIGKKKLVTIKTMEHEIKGPVITKVFNEAKKFLDENI